MTTRFVVEANHLGKGDAMKDIRLPRVAVSRELAVSLTANIDGSVDEVIVDGRGLVVNNESFAFELAKELSALKPKKVALLGGSPKWHKDMEKAAQKYSIGIEETPLSLT